MLATFVIGLREGLEAVLVISIVAAFLKRNGISRRPMWLGVALAVLICVAVGIGLSLFDQSLPQVQQEALETIIGLLAVIFVVMMIVWMGKHARGLSAEIQEAASTAVGKGTGWALIVMAFLAVVKEGFETAVFLLATLQASTTVWAAAIGAVAGIGVACLVGYGLYRGSVKLNLSRFFRISSVFLVFVAAGLLMTAVRKAHGAGWIDIGQQRTVDLSWLAPVGSVQSALLTGVLGIPSDPRVIEVLAWVLFLVPMLALVLWPRLWSPSPRGRVAVKASLAAAAAVVAAVLALAVPSGMPSLPTTLALSDGGGTVQIDGQQPLRLRVSPASGDEERTTLSAPTAEQHLGAPTTRWTAHPDSGSSSASTTLTLDQLATMFGRIPVGISALKNPGPFQAAQTREDTITAWTAAGGLVDANRTAHTTIVLTGGGLTGSRTLTLDRTDWSAAETAASARAQSVIAGQQAAREASLWRIWLPLVLAVAAALLLLSSWSDARALRRAAAASAPASPGTSPVSPDPSRRSLTHVSQ